MTPAEQLRRASETLREMAGAATPGPWSAEEGASGSWWVELRNLGDVAHDLHGENARLIALMDPTLALLVADWLSHEAGRPEVLPVGEEFTVGGPSLVALALAEYVNGRTHG